MRALNKRSAALERRIVLEGALGIVEGKDDSRDENSKGGASVMSTLDICPEPRSCSVHRSMAKGYNQDNQGA